MSQATAPAAAVPTVPPDDPTPKGEDRDRRGLMLSLLRQNGLLVVILAIAVGLALNTDTFLTTRNLLNVLDQSAPVGILACAITICIIAGIFDLSVGAIYGVAAVTAANVANHVDPVVGMLAGVAAGLALGLANASIVHVTRIHSFIGTLSTSIVYRGLAIVVTGGLIVTVDKPAFGFIGTSTLLGVQYTVWVFGAFALITSIVLARTAFGRYVYAVGGNEDAARLAGVPTELVRAACFALSGLAAGIAGVLAASRTSSAQADLGTGLELAAISAAVVGGTNIEGGEGAVWRGVAGVLALALIGNAFNLLDINPTYQVMVQGLLILIAVGTDHLLKGRRR